MKDASRKDEGFPLPPEYRRRGNWCCAGCAIGLLTQDTTLIGNDCLLVGNNLGLIFLNGFLVGQHGGNLGDQLVELALVRHDCRLVGIMAA